MASAKKRLGGSARSYICAVLKSNIVACSLTGIFYNQPNKENCDLSKSAGCIASSHRRFLVTAREKALTRSRSARSSAIDPPSPATILLNAIVDKHATSGSVNSASYTTLEVWLLRYLVLNNS